MRLKLTGKHSSHVGKLRVGAACLTLGWQRGPSPLHHRGVRWGEGEVGLCWIWLEDNEELHRVSDRETHRSLVLRCKERWLSDWEGQDWVWNEFSTASSTSVPTPPPPHTHHSHITISGCLSSCLPFGEVSKASLLCFLSWMSRCWV